MQLQLKAQQRVFRTDGIRSYTPDMTKPIKIGFDDPKEHRALTEVRPTQNSWNKLNMLPKSSVKKVVNGFILKKDKGKA